MLHKVTYIRGIFKHYLLEKFLGFWGAQPNKKLHFMSTYNITTTLTWISFFSPRLQFDVMVLFSKLCNISKENPMDHFHIQLWNIKKYNFTFKCKTMSPKVFLNRFEFLQFEYEFFQDLFTFSSILITTSRY